MSENLLSRHVFIDTSVFRNYNFCLDNDVFSEFSRLCHKEELHYITTGITRKEISCRIEDQAKEAFDALKKFREKTQLLTRVHSAFGKKYKELTVASLQEDFEGGVNRFFRKSKAKELPFPNDCAQRVFKRYFRREKPFNEDKKKYEFPDAFVIEALLKLKKRIYVISTDGNFANVHENLIKLNSLGELLHIYNAHSNAMTEFIQALVKKNENTLLKRLESELSHLPAKMEGSDSIVRLNHDSHVKIDDVWVVSIKDKTAELSIDATYNVIGDIPYEHPTVYWPAEDFQNHLEIGARAEISFKPKDESVFKLNSLRLEENELIIPDNGMSE